jgi:hypothetical protein
VSGTVLSFQDERRQVLLFGIGDEIEVLGVPSFTSGDHQSRCSSQIRGSRSPDGSLSSARGGCAAAGKLASEPGCADAKRREAGDPGVDLCKWPAGIGSLEAPVRQSALLDRRGIQLLRRLAIPRAVEEMAM